MNEPYLWDRSGPPPEELRKLEESFSAWGHVPAFAWPARKTLPWWKPALACAAALFVTIAVFLWFRTAPASEWRDGNGRPLAWGAHVIATSATPVTLTAENTGSLELAPGSELRLASSRGGKQTLRLLQGEIHALIWARPGNFVVDTPSTEAVDLGCQYRLRVDPAGNGLLTVETGWVALKAADRHSFIPAGAACRTHRDSGPALPYYLDSSPELQSAVSEYSEHPDSAAVRAILLAARPHDAFTVWHLISRAPAADVAAVVDRFLELSPPSAALSRAALLQRNPQALDAAWDTLQLGEMAWWRTWERTWK